MKSDHCDMLTQMQQAAYAKLLWASAQPKSLSVLVGPGGVGKTLIGKLMASDARVDGICKMIDADAIDNTRNFLPDGACIILVDNAHKIEAVTLSLIFKSIEFSETVRRALILIGQGRLLTLLHKQPEIERAVRIRAVLLPWSFEETTQQVVLHLGESAVSDEAIEIIHESSAGVPAAVLNVLELAKILIASLARPLDGHDMEKLVGRLRLIAA